MPLRKLSFQLTPLLDLLLIVFFAQYLEVRTVVREEAGRLQAAQHQLTADLDETLHQLLALREHVARFDEVESQRQALSQDVQHVRAQRDLVGELVRELFRLPESAVETIVKEKSVAGPGPSAAEIRQLKQQLQELSQSRSEEIVDHLLTFHELRKRCDLWDLYIQDDGQIVLHAGEQTQVFRAEKTEAFNTRLFDAYKALPQPKSLVLVLVSYGDVRLGVRQAVLEGLPEAIERIRVDDEGRSRFDYAVLGFRPESQKGDAP